MDWSTACPDWEARILGGRPLVPELPLFQEEADRAVRIFNRLRIPDVPGKPRFADAIGDWFRQIVAALFGAYDASTNRRMISELFLLVPKKNSKSTGAAGIMVTAAIMNRRPAAELLLVAPTKEIADISFGQASGMIRADEHLNKLFHLQQHIRTITHLVSEAKIQIKAADTDVITGGKQTATLIDETHVFAAHSKAREIFVELRGALAARPDGFLMQITTQSKSPPAGVFRAELMRARAVRDGRRSLPLLPVLYELPAGLVKAQAWKDRRYWPTVNPNLGRSVDPAFLEREMQTAEDEGAEQLALFASQHLNVEIGLGLTTDRWAGADRWEAAALPGLTLEALVERCEVAVVGIDGGGLDDLLGLAVMGREKGTRLAALVPGVGPRVRARAPQGDRPASARLRGRGHMARDRQRFIRGHRRRRRDRRAARERRLAAAQARDRRRPGRRGGRGRRPRARRLQRGSGGRSGARHQAGRNDPQHHHHDGRATARRWGPGARRQRADGLACRTRSAGARGRRSSPSANPCQPTSTWSPTFAPSCARSCSRTAASQPR
jgi:phage terminase large subunit-like protein